MTGPYAATLATAMLNLFIIIILGEVKANAQSFFFNMDLYPSRLTFVILALGFFF